MYTYIYIYICICMYIYINIYIHIVDNASCVFMLYSALCVFMLCREDMHVRSDYACSACAAAAAGSTTIRSVERLAECCWNPH